MALYESFIIEVMTEVKKLDINPQMNPAAMVVNYIRSKCGLTPDQVEKKLMNGEMFDTIKGEGADIDTKLMDEILNDNDYYEKPNQKILKDEAMKFICEIVEQWSI